MQRDTADPVDDGSKIEHDLIADAERLHQAFLRQRPLYVNLLDDLGTCDFYVIDGDSLLFDCLGSCHSDATHGVQMLQLIYLVEKFLHGLQNCLNSRFCFVFFRKHNSFWQHAPSYRLARCVLQAHLQQALGQTVHTAFDSWYSQKWLQYIKQEQPAFLLVTDLASVSQEAIVGSKLGHVQEVMQACIMYNLSVRLPIAFMAELRVQQDMAFGFKFTEIRNVPDKAGCHAAAFHVGRHLLQNTMCLESWVDHGQISLTHIPPLDVSAWRCERQRGILQTFEWLSSAGAWACAQLLKSTSASSQSSSLSASLYSDRTATLLFCNAWCLHEAAKAHIPLEDRCLDLELLEQSMHSRTAKTLDVDISASASATSIPEQQTTSQPSADAYKALLPFMDCWCSSVHKLLVQEVLSGQLDETDQLRLADIVDGRLWHVMACSLLTATPVGLAPTALQTAAQLMHAICQLADVSPQSAVLFTSMQRPSAVAKDTQQQTIKVVDQSSPLQLVLRHSVHHNSFVDAFLGPQPAHEQGQELQSDDGSIVAVFGEAYHWHTGRPLEPTYLGETADERLLAVWSNATLDQMTRCPLLSPGKRLRLKEVISMCQDTKLIPKPTEREGKLKAALKAAHNWIETRLRRREQQQATFMRNYAASMMSTTYQGPSTPVAPLKGKPKSASTASKSNNSKGSKPAKPIKLSKADQIRQQQTAKRASEGAARLADKWAAKQQELERCVQVAGWDSRLQSEVARFLAGCKQEAPSAYLAASVFLLEHSLNAWKQACQNRRRRADAAPTQQPAAGVLAAGSSSDLANAMPHAVAIWLTVQDVVGKGFLSAADNAGVERELAKKAGKLCEQAMQLLGFAQAAAHVSSLLAALKGTKPAKASRQVKQGSKTVSSGNTAATAATAGGGTASEAHPPGATAVSSAEKAVNHSAASCDELQGSSSSSNSRASGSISSSNTNSSSNRAFGVGMTEAQFQLQHCGNLLQRDAPAVSDPRVISFNPDSWQRDVLDVIDADASAVVCAPTSSGKTFISSYCMDRVLRQSKDGTVVFVAPTKALVNQTAAQVLKDFSKGDKSVCGVFTRDYRVNALEARVLVTVPACLEILLFSPAHRDWVARLRYVIFDEVHCMREGGIREGGTAENTGTIWEHCLLLIRCPFLALSATIGNPEQVTEWLQSVKGLQREQDSQLSIAGPPDRYQVKLIQHAERYADLRYHTFKPCSAQQDDQLRAPGLQQTSDMFTKIHPCAVLTAEQLQDSGFPSEISLEPCDCLELFNAMHSVSQAAASSQSAPSQAVSSQAASSNMDAERVSLLHPVAESSNTPVAQSAVSRGPASEQIMLREPMLLGIAASSTAGNASSLRLLHWATAAQSFMQDNAPDAYFPDGKAILRSAVRAWEKVLKQELVLWARDHGTAGLQAVGQVLGRLKASSGWDPSRVYTNESSNPLQFYSMLRALDKQEMLPMLTFSFDRRKCESLADGIVRVLESAEAERREASGADSRKEEVAAERARKASKANRDRKTGRKAAEDALQEDASELAEMEEDSIDPDFSFAGRVRSMSPQELREQIDQGTFGFEEGHPLKRALQRGIGVHHSGLPTKYRQVVEILFRCRYLRVVIATGTLAYGINMPCRTVAFAGDHIFLNSLQFRQMTGRAGRRGFDTLGHVIFWGVPSRKCTSLLVSPVPRLHGNFPLSLSLSLRALTLHSAAPGDPQLQNDLLRLMQRPFYASEDPHLQQKMQHLFQFSLQYLQLQSTLNAQGQPVQLAGMAMHLFWAEPANFAFVSLLRKGVFHSICAGARLNANGPLPDQVAHELLLVLSHVFERLLLPPFVQGDDASIRTSPSRVILEPLSPGVATVLAEHNQEAVDNLVAYITSYISSRAGLLPAANVLPLSGFSYPPCPVAAPPDGVSALQQAECEPELSAGDAQSAGMGSSCMQSTGLGVLQIHHKKHHVSSPFVSLSGHDEVFSSSQQLLQSVRPGILLDAASVPSVQMTDRHGRELPLNRYILDYWGHGQKQALVHANGLREGDAWEHLRTFVGILRAIATAMEKMVEGTAAAADPVVHSFSKLAQSFNDKHKAFNSAHQSQRG